MIPLPMNPTVILRLNDNDEVIGVASNVAPLPELRLEVTRSQRIFDELAKGKPFNQKTSWVFYSK